MCFSSELQDLDCSSSVAKYVLLFFEDMTKFAHLYCTKHWPLQFRKFVGTIPWDPNSVSDKLDITRDWRGRCIQEELSISSKWSSEDKSIHSSGAIYGRF